MLARTTAPSKRGALVYVVPLTWLSTRSLGSQLGECSLKDCSLIGFKKKPKSLEYLGYCFLRNVLLD
jgi:hypothetical protein